VPESGRTLVLKFGGSAFAPDILRPFAARVHAFRAAGDRVVIVHGGGKEITSLLERLGKKSVFIDGLRVTDDETLEATEMVLSGRINKALVRGLLAGGVRSVGLAGTDAALLMATPLAAEREDAQGRKFRIDYGHVGDVTEVHADVLETLLQAHYVPVVSPLALTAGGAVLNVNADTAAARIAGALRAEVFLLLTDVPGVLVPGPGGPRVAAELTRAEVDAHKMDGTIRGGMIPKVDACLDALSRGAKTARIASLQDFLNAPAPTGTVLHGG
jgi:acetylglutamate kinase